MRFFEVGGCVRDELLGVETHDIDFAVEMPVRFWDLGPEACFSLMRGELESQGFKIHQERPEHFTIRCGVPKGHKLRDRTKDADFVMCRMDGPTKDGRRPQWVQVSHLASDLSRRDFTMNAIARDDIGVGLIDPHGGVADIKRKTLRFVGDPERRIREDGLRVLRGLRFVVTKGFTPTPTTAVALMSDFAAEMLFSVSVERIGTELAKMLDHNVLLTLDVIASMPEAHKEAIFRDGLKLAPTLRKNVRLMED